MSKEFSGAIVSKELLIIDIETTGFNWRHKTIHGVGLCTEEDETRYVRTDEALSTITRFRSFMGHNLRFDLRFLIENGLELDLQQVKLWDTKLIAQLIDENRPLGLKPLSVDQLGAFSLENKSELDSIMDKERVKDLGEFCRLDLEIWNGQYRDLIGQYCQEDCNNTYKLGVTLMQQLKEKHAKIQKVFPGHKTPLDYLLDEALPLEPVLLDMDRRGVRINHQKMLEYKEALLKENAEYQEKMEAICAMRIEDIENTKVLIVKAKKKTQKAKDKVVRGINKASCKTKFLWTSPADLAELFYKRFGVDESLLTKTKTGAFTTSESALNELRKKLDDGSELKEVLTYFAKFKKNQKLLSTYIGEEKGLSSFIENDRVYPEYMQTGANKESDKGGTVTGRLSAKDPPIQTLPRRGLIRQFYIPDSPEHVFLYLDYSQLELRLAAHLSKDKKLMSGYIEGVDLHQLTADRIGQDRQVGKKTNFSMIYNASPYRLVADLNTVGDTKYSFEDCQQIIREFFEEYHEYKAYLDEQRAFMLRYLGVMSEAGRVRKLPDLALGSRLQWRPNMRYKGPYEDLLRKNEESLTHMEAFKRANKKFRHALNQGYNFPIQSLGASITKRAMIQLWKKGFQIVTQIHDSIIMQVLKTEAHEKMKEAQQIMENVYPLSVPLIADPKLLLSFDEDDRWEGE